MLVFVKESVSTFVADARVRLVADEAWDASDPVVKALPGLFADRPSVVRGSVAPVEAATAAPGEKRSVAKKSAAKKA